MSHWATFFKTRIFTLKGVLFLLVSITLGITLQQYLLPERDYFGVMHPHYNNYLIFKHSFPHLINNLNLYEAYPAEYGDLFKYSPTFAFSMGLFYYLPDLLGIVLWNLINMFCLFIGIKLLPRLNEKIKIFILLFVLFELIGNLQNEQSNGLITGLMLLTFVFFERKNVFLAALFIGLAFYIKIFGLVATTLFLLYPQKTRFLIYLGLWLVILWLLPLLVTSPTELVKQYDNRLVLLQADHGTSYGFSIMGVLNKWMGINPSRWLVTIVGIFLFCLGYIRRDLFQDFLYRYLFLSSILIWVILFNHKSESPTYIIAMAGCGIWFFIQKPTTVNTILIILAFIFVSLTLTDLFPHAMRSLLYKYYVKTLPVIIIWCVIIYQMLTGNYKPNASLGI